MDGTFIAIQLSSRYIFPNKGTAAYKSQARNCKQKGYNESNIYSGSNCKRRQKRTRTIGPNDNGGFGLAVELAVNISGVSMEEAQQLAERAHQVCPYSNALRNNVEVKITATNNG